MSFQEGSCSDTTIFAGEATTKFPSLCQTSREGGLVFSWWHMLEGAIFISLILWVSSQLFSYNVHNFATINIGWVYTLEWMIWLDSMQNEEFQELWCVGFIWLKPLMVVSELLY